MQQNGNFEFKTRAVDVAKINKILNIIPGTNTECQEITEITGCSKSIRVKGKN